ncbi:MAG TPA: protein kinase [Polyangiales bacterium]
MLSPRAAQPASTPPFQVERYAVCDEFAAGGMASVHFARLLGAHGFRRTVAVKRLLPHLSRNRDFALMLIDEARLAARVCHPNVVTTLDVVQSDGELLLVMEYVHGESLAKLSRWAGERGEPIPLAIACAIVADVLHGLHAAHEARDEQGAPLGLVHRDVSPQNMLIGVDGIPRIADFGVAKAAGRAQNTGDGILKGKLAYMAPEQLSSGEVSRASDLFAAAVVLWETLAGERLFAGKNHAETTFKLLSAPIPPLRAKSPGVSAELEAVVMRGLARDPTARFASARDMALAIEGCAPSVRPSELAAWVERVVGDRLASRLALLRSIERSDDATGDAPLGTATSVQRAEEADAGNDEPEPPTTPRLSASQRSAAVRMPPALAVGVGLVLASALVGLAARSSRGAPAGGRATPPAATVEAPAAPRSHPPSLDVRRSNAAAPAVAPHDASVRAAAVERTGAVEKAGHKPPRVSKPRDKRPDCDPPYTIDNAGHVLFTPACM